MDTPLRLRTLWPGVYLPAIVVELGIGAMIPFVPAAVVARGGSLATAGLVVAMLAVGRIVADLPAGALAARIGDRHAMMLASLLAAGAAALAAWAPSVALLAASLFLLGACDAVFGLARQSYVTAVVPAMQRARALSTLGGVHRIGFFLGPFAAAAVVRDGDPSLAFLLAVGASLVGFAAVALSPDLPHAREEAADAGHGSVTAVVRLHGRLLATLGTAIAAIGLVRGARGTVLPLWGAHLGLAPSTTALIVGVSAGVDMLLFYPAGRLMDARGRLWTAIPSMITMGLAFALLPLTSTLAGLAAVALLLGLGNGMGSGVVMTLGADVAPPADRAAFLGAWRLLQDSGNALGPLVLAGGAALGSLAGGVGAMAVLAGGAALAQWRLVPRYSIHANRTTRRRAGLS